MGANVTQTFFVPSKSRTLESAIGLTSSAAVNVKLVDLHNSRNIYLIRVTIITN